MLIDYIKTFRSKSLLSFQLFHADERLHVFVLKVSGLELTSCMRLDTRKDNSPVKPT